MKIRIIIALVCMLIFFACKNDTSYPKLSLLQYGLPIDIQAPEGATVEAEDLIFMKDVTVKSGEDYFVQIFYTKETPNKLSTLLEETKKEVQESELFSKMIQEDENGFIFEKKIGDRVNYDFRLIKIIGDNEYKFQTGMIGTFSEDAVRKMYDSVK